MTDAEHEKLRASVNRLAQAMRDHEEAGGFPPLSEYRYRCLARDLLGWAPFSGRPANTDASRVAPLSASPQTPASPLGCAHSTNPQE